MVIHEEITERLDECALRRLSDALTLIEASVQGRGVQELRVGCDPDHMIELNVHHVESWPPLIPMYDPKHCALGPHNLACTEALDVDGRTVATHLCRFYETHSTLAQEIPSMRPLYDDPQRHFERGETFDITEVYDSASLGLSGPNVCSGGLWVHPDRRKMGIKEAIAYASRLSALALWPEVRYFWALRWVKTTPSASVGRDPKIAGKISAQTGWRGPLEILLVVFALQDVRDDCAAFLDSCKRL